MQKVPKTIQDPIYRNAMPDPVLVIDNGTCLMKAGYRSFNPQIVFPNYFYKTKNSCTLTKQPSSTFKTMFENDVVINVENLEITIDFILNFLVFGHKGNNPINESYKVCNFFNGQDRTSLKTSGLNVSDLKLSHSFGSQKKNKASSLPMNASASLQSSTVSSEVLSESADENNSCETTSFSDEIAIPKRKRKGAFIKNPKNNKEDVLSDTESSDVTLKRPKNSKSKLKDTQKHNKSNSKKDLLSTNNKRNTRKSQTKDTLSKNSTYTGKLPLIKQTEVNKRKTLNSTIRPKEKVQIARNKKSASSKRNKETDGSSYKIKQGSHLNNNAGKSSKRKKEYSEDSIDEEFHANISSSDDSNKKNRMEDILPGKGILKTYINRSRTRVNKIVDSSSEEFSDSHILNLQNEGNPHFSSQLALKKSVEFQSDIKPELSTKDANSFEENLMISPKKKEISYVSESEDIPNAGSLSKIQKINQKIEKFGQKTSNTRDDSHVDHKSAITQNLQSIFQKCLESELVSNSTQDSEEVSSTETGRCDMKEASILPYFYDLSARNELKIYNSYLDPLPFSKRRNSFISEHDCMKHTSISSRDRTTLSCVKLANFQCERAQGSYCSSRNLQSTIQGEESCNTEEKQSLAEICPLNFKNGRKPAVKNHKKLKMEENESGFENNIDHHEEHHNSNSNSKQNEVFDVFTKPLSTEIIHNLYKRVPKQLILTDALFTPPMYQIQKLNMLFEVFRFEKIQIGIDCVYSYLYNVEESLRATSELKLFFKESIFNHSAVIIDSKLKELYLDVNFENNSRIFSDTSKTAGVDLFKNDNDSAYERKFLVENRKIIANSVKKTLYRKSILSCKKPSCNNLDNSYFNDMFREEGVTIFNTDFQNDDIFKFKVNLENIEANGFNAFSNDKSNNAKINASLNNKSINNELNASSNDKSIINASLNDKSINTEINASSNDKSINIFLQNQCLALNSSFEQSLNCLQSCVDLQSCNDLTNTLSNISMINKRIYTSDKTHLYFYPESKYTHQFPFYFYPTVYSEIDLIVSIGHTFTLIIAIQSERIVAQYKIPYAYKAAKSFLTNTLALKNIYLHENEIDELMELSRASLDYKNESIALIQQIETLPDDVEPIEEFEDFYEFIDFTEETIAIIKTAFRQNLLNQFFENSEDKIDVIHENLRKNKWYVKEKPLKVNFKEVNINENDKNNENENKDINEDFENENDENLNQIVKNENRIDVNKNKTQEKQIDVNENKTDENQIDKNNIKIVYDQINKNNIKIVEDQINIDSINELEHNKDILENTPADILENTPADLLENTPADLLENILDNFSGMSFHQKMIYFKNTPAEKLTPSEEKEKRKITILFKMGIARYNAKIKKTLQTMRRSVEITIKNHEIISDIDKYINKTIKSYNLIKNELKNRKILRDNAKIHHSLENHLLNLFDNEASIDENSQKFILDIKLAEDADLEKILKRKLYVCYSYLLENNQIKALQTNSIKNKYKNMSYDIDLMRIVEGLFEPSVIYMKQKGICEILDELCAFKIKNTFLTGGYGVIIKNIDKRLELEINKRSKFGQTNVIRSKDGRFDAFRGAQFSKAFPTYTLDNYDQKIINEY